jgi:hypothetical protein
MLSRLDLLCVKNTLQFHFNNVKVHLHIIKPWFLRDFLVATQSPHPLDQLEPEDKEFVLRFVRASGSLKEVAQTYDVSYPTLRARLDRLIDRLEQLADRREPDPMADMLAKLVERGELATRSARQILNLHRGESNSKPN